MILKDLKIGDIDKSKVTIQRTPKNLEFGNSKKKFGLKTSKLITENPNHSQTEFKKNKQTNK
jgi:hypothetical protein